MLIFPENKKLPAKNDHLIQREPHEQYPRGDILKDKVEVNKAVVEAKNVGRSIEKT